MKGKDKNLLAFGIFNAISVFPVCILVMVVGFAALAFTGAKWNVLTGILCLFFFFLSPISCIIGIVKGIRSWKSSRICATVCVVLSIIGILLFAVVTGYLWWRSAIS
ncbi:MAG: hypothetical protein K2K21_05570 [Lachnospiraceae bacterium]|nr:hypothetical protein [Lachnospiraceae bacterium]